MRWHSRARAWPSFLHLQARTFILLGVYVSILAVSSTYTARALRALSGVCAVRGVHGGVAPHARGGTRHLVRAITRQPPYRRAGVILSRHRSYQLIVYQPQCTRARAHTSTHELTKLKVGTPFSRPTAATRAARRRGTARSGRRRGRPAGPQLRAADGYTRGWRGGRGRGRCILCVGCVCCVCATGGGPRSHARLAAAGAVASSGGGSPTALLRLLLLLPSSSCSSSSYPPSPPAASSRRPGLLPARRARA